MPTITQSYILQYGADGLALNGRSRGAMTIGNAMESLASNPAAAGLMTNTTIYLLGPAYNAQNMANMLYGLSGGQQNSVNLQNHTDDFVGGIIGGNPSTYGTTPQGSSTVGEWINMFFGKTTVHNCYGAGSEKCINTYGPAVTLPIRSNSK